MKMTLALASVIALLCTLAHPSDGNNKDDKKPDSQPVKIALTAAQSKAIQEIDQQFQRLQEEAQKQAQILSARESGLLTAFVMGTKLEGKQYKLVKEKEGYVVEEVVPATPESAPSTPGTEDKRVPGQSNPPASPAQVNSASPPKKEQN